MTKNQIPAIKPGVAIQSLRHSGYDLPTALGEPIDNSLEAGANLIQVRLEESPGKKNKKHVHRIVISDDGNGMDAETLHHYLQLGFSTRYMQLTTIGKFGVGAKLAALNFACRIDAWSRQSKTDPWRHVHLDVHAALKNEEDGGEVTIGEPQIAELPPDLEELAPTGSGTIVVWSKIDRLEEGRYAKDVNSLRVDVEKELSRLFRYFLHGGRRIVVNGNELLAHDPLFRMDRTWADQVLTEQTRDGTGKRKLERHFDANMIVDREPIAFGGGKAYLTVTVYPKEVVRVRGKGGDELAKKLRVPENEGAISFVRQEREISYTTVPKILPQGVQAQDRHIGIEVLFTPELDEYFGVRNVKRGVEPHGELRDEIRKRLQRYIKAARDKIEELWGAKDPTDQPHTSEVAPVEDGVAEANRVLPQPRVPTAPAVEVNRALEELADDANVTDEKEREAFKERRRDLPVIIESVAFPGSNFLDITHLGSNIIIRMNKRHRFYRELWEPLLDLSQRPSAEVTGEEAVRASRRAIEALTLLVTAYAKAESMDDTPDDNYGDLRNYWGQFLETLLGKIKGVM